MVRDTWFIPDPVRSLVVVLVAAALGGMGGFISGVSPEDVFLNPAQAPARLTTVPGDALPGLDAVLALAPEFEARDIQEDASGSAPFSNAEPPEGLPPYDEWGRTEAGRVAFWRPNATTEPGPVEVQAEISSYRDIGGAQRAFAYWSGRLAAEASPVPVELSADESAAYQLEAPPFLYQWVQFRKMNGFGIVLVSGPTDQTSPEAAAAIAEGMAQRMR